MLTRVLLATDRVVVRLAASMLRASRSEKEAVTVIVMDADSAAGTEILAPGYIVLSAAAFAAFLPFDSPWTGFLQYVLVSCSAAGIVFHLSGGVFSGLRRAYLHRPRPSGSAELVATMSLAGALLVFSFLAPTPLDSLYAG